MDDKRVAKAEDFRVSGSNDYCFWIECPDCTMENTMNFGMSIAELIEFATGHECPKKD